MGGHAVLSPSAAGRWLACTPSARLEERFPDTAGDYAKEGTLAHAFGEAFLRGALGADVRDELEKLRESEFYSIDLEDYADTYAAYVWCEFCLVQKLTPDAVLLVEERIDLREYVPEGFGTGDAVLIADGTLTIIDLKYGKGVRVSATENKQMMLYALGALHKYELLYGVDRVRMVIYQPRLGNVSTWEMGADDLKRWANDYLMPRALMAYRGEGEYVAGEHCRFCRARAMCKALAEEKTAAVANYPETEVGLMSDEEVAAVLSAASGIKSWLSAVEEHALQRALEGHSYPGFKLVEGRSVRRYTDEKAVADELLRYGYKEEQIYEPPKLKTITQMEKMLTKKTFGTLLQGLVVKPAGKPTLVEVTDSRPEWSSAAADFAGV